MPLKEVSMPYTEHMDIGLWVTSIGVEFVNTTHWLNKPGECCSVASVTNLYQQTAISTNSLGTRLVKFDWIEYEAQRHKGVVHRKIVLR